MLVCIQQDCAVWIFIIYQENIFKIYTLCDDNDVGIMFITKWPLCLFTSHKWIMLNVISRYPFGCGLLMWLYIHDEKFLSSFPLRYIDIIAFSYKEQMSFWIIHLSSESSKTKDVYECVNAHIDIADYICIIILMII